MTDDSDAPVTVFQEEPFRLTFAAESAPEDFLTLTVGEVDVSAITSDRVEMKYILHLRGSGLETQEASLATEAERVEAEPPSESLILYFTQPGEETWDIARRYRLPRAQLMEMNPGLENAEPTPGQSVVVWHR